MNEDAAWVRKFDQKNFAWVDGSIVFEHIILAATAEGLSTVWIEFRSVSYGKSLQYSY